jgi:hypothetical protein
VSCNHDVEEEKLVHCIEANDVKDHGARDGKCKRGHRLEHKGAVMTCTSIARMTMLLCHFFGINHLSTMKKKRLESPSRQERDMVWR